MDHCRRLLITFLCLAIALAGRGPVTELGAFGNGHDDRAASAAHPAHASLAHAGEAGQAHLHGAGSHGESIAHGQGHGADGGRGTRGDSCACGCDMGSCAAMPADLSLQHPDLARIDPRIDLPALRTAPLARSPMAPLLRPPIG